MQNTQPRSSIAAVVIVLSLMLSSSIFARQTVPPSPLTIQQAVDDALRNYPSIAVSQEQINAAAAAIDLARTAYLPRVDGIAQVNRATRNNVFGLLLPQGVIPSISGPVLGSNNFGTVWGSAAGALVTWEPFDFGLRGAGVSAATASRTHNEATLKRTQFDVSVAAADAFLTLVAAQETVRAAQAGVDRGQVLAQTVRAQADAQLRPGADASRAEAELAAARTQLAQAQQAEEVARALLAQFVGYSATTNRRSADEAASASTGAAGPTARRGTESHSRGTECRHRSKKSRASGSGEILCPPVFRARFGLCAREPVRELDGTQTWRAQRPGAGHAELCAGFHRHFSHCSILRRFVRAKRDSRQRSAPKPPDTSKSQRN